MQHRFLNVEFKCRQCNQTHALLFDCITLQKRKRCGYYARDYVTLSVSDKPQTYASIEEVNSFNLKIRLFKVPIFRPLETCGTDLINYQPATIAKFGRMICIKAFLNKLEIFIF